ncbi:dihydrofolate reductase family protein [Parafrankia sp. EUN1f]|uniref:dihydrofolate reductase family protein n=1 Tax=Parafrankia sp. EUN1f TaxID=102897 RepID=UPI0001C4514A|nr:dihydrofolate reductase family protein [Parafrankia sp. EUN1f]EFC84641.1 bifunctional deaminase-reductase domain protein [Parafrankia sp. EUN1f]
MRRLVAVEFLSVDGVMQGLGSPDEDRDGGFEHGGWGVPFAEALHEVIDPAGLGGTSAYLFGRRTYEKMAAFWPFQPDDNPMAAALNATPKYVATRTLSAPLPWKGAEPLEGDLVTAVTRLKNAEDRADVVILGSGALVRQLMEVDLVDELRLFVHPLLLGAGKHLFGGLPAPRPLQLTSSATTSRGTVALTYAVEGRRPRPASV